MSDAMLVWGADLKVGSTGDLELVDDADAGQQRVVRRLLTNAGAYIWQPDYGAGLGSFVGSPIQVPRLKAAVRQQMWKEASIARTPAPVISVTGSNGDHYNTTVLSVQYVDTVSDSSQTLSLQLNR